MAKHGFKVVDSDMHIMEPADLWQEYIDPEFKYKAQVGVGRFGVQVEGTFLSRIRDEHPGTRTARAKNSEIDDQWYAFAQDREWDPTSQIEAMDKEGIDLAVLFPHPWVVHSGAGYAKEAWHRGDGRLLRRCHSQGL